MNCQAYFSFEDVSFDHRTVMAKIRLNLRRNTTRTKTTVHYERPLLNNRDIRYRFALTLRNKFNALLEKTETHTPNDEYENVVNVHVEATAKCIASKQRTKPRAPWDTLVVRKKRPDVKTVSKYNRKNWTNTNARKLKRHKINLLTYT